MLVETFIRKMLRLKAHRVIAVDLSAEHMVIRIDRLGRPPCFVEGVAGRAVRLAQTLGSAVCFASLRFG